MDQSTCCPPRLLWRFCIHDRANIWRKTEENHRALRPWLFSYPLGCAWTPWEINLQGVLREWSWKLLGMCCGTFLLSHCGQPWPATLSLLLPSSLLIFFLNLGKNSNSSIRCQMYFNLGWRRIVKCFPFLKNNLNFGRSSSPPVNL